jgi:glycosyltransferase involved in cell wall biosynthesis
MMSVLGQRSQSVTNDNQCSSVRALFVLPSDGLGGAERVAVTLAECAAKTGRFNEIDIYILSRADSGRLANLRRYANIRVIYSRASREATGIIPFARFVKGRKYDLVFATHAHINAYCCALRRFGLLRTRRLVTRESHYTFDYNWGRAMAPILRSIVLFCYGNQDLIICQTRAMADRFHEKTQSRFRSRTIALANPIDMDRVNNWRTEDTALLEHIPSSHIKIVWCGRLVEFKRPHRAVQVLKHLCETDSRPFHLVIIGDGPLRKIVEDEIARSGTRAHVTLCGYQPNPIKIMALCHYGLLTSDLEGFPNVILEMLAAGVRGVVTTDCAGELDLIHGVRVVRDPAALAAAIIEMVESPPSAGFDKVIATRSPSRFLAAILAEGS